MTKLEKLKAAHDAAWEAYDAAYAAYEDACDAAWAAYQDELRRHKEENSND